jgi:gluconolactonase
MRAAARCLILSATVFPLVAMAHTRSDGPSERGIGRIERLDPRFDRLVPRDAILEKVADGLVWAEGPLWVSREHALLFSDVPRNGVFRWKEGEGVRLFLDASGYSGTTPFEGREPGSNGLALDAEGRLVLCQHGNRRVARLDPDGRITVLADRYEGRRLNSPNDLVYRANGDLYFTDPPFGLPKTFSDPDKELPFQGVYRLTPEGALTVVVTDLGAPNGIALSPDERTLYVSNAEPADPIWRTYEIQEDGTLAHGRQFAEARAWVKGDNGLPDGLKTDREGNVFATGPDGVHVFAPDGARLGIIHTGVRTGNLTWGEDGRVLYIAANQWILRLRTTTLGKSG